MTGIVRRLPPKKSFGQHFLHDVSVLTRIADAVPFTDAHVFVEVGPGQGALTVFLYERLCALGRGGDLVLVELDTALLADLRLRFPLARVVHADAAQVDWYALTGGVSWYLVGNLPYNAGTAIVNNAFYAAHPPQGAVVMLQKEVGERILAVPPHMSMLSLSMQLVSAGSKVCTVKPGAFFPPPKVDSVVLALVYTLVCDAPVRTRILHVAKQGFTHPRKQLCAVLADAGIFSREECKQQLLACGLSPLARPGELSVKDWRCLVDS